MIFRFFDKNNIVIGGDRNEQNDYEILKAQSTVFRLNPTASVPFKTKLNLIFGIGKNIEHKSIRDLFKRSKYFIKIYPISRSFVLVFRHEQKTQDDLPRGRQLTRCICPFSCC